mgnify:CR=1 FL=1
MNKTAFIFPGQGAQKCGMGKDFYEKSSLAKAIFDTATAELGIDMQQLCFEENDQLDQTEYTQAAMVTACLAMTAEIEKRGLTPDVTAGLSLGEYCAISAAGGMQPKDAISLVRKRGILMQNTVPAGEGAMAAILGLDGDTVAEVTGKIPGASVANYNCPGQIVITGEEAAVARAAESLKEAGAKRTVALKVSGPFHSKMLTGAGEKLGEALKEVELHDFSTPYITNVTADYVTSPAGVKELLRLQVSSSVRWQQSVERMIADGVDTFVEIGPGKTLSGFMRKIDRSAKTLNIENMADFEKAMAELKGE